MRVDMTPQNFRAADVLKIRQCDQKNQNNFDINVLYRGLRRDRRSVRLISCYGK